MATRTAAPAPGIFFSSPPPRFLNSASLPANGLRLAAARAGDHPSIHRLLMSVFHGPSATEFHAQLDEPSYQPADRLVVKDGDLIEAHVRLAAQSVQFGNIALPVARFMDVATAPEYRSRGLATALLAAAERAAAERGALIGLTRTRAPSLFARLGWSVCGRHYYSTAAPRAVLAELGALASGAMERAPGPAFDFLRERPAHVTVRPLRRVEFAEVRRLYEQSLAGRYGWPIRTAAYWDWLLARGACDRVYVAAAESEPADLSNLPDSIIGYAFVRQSRIVELIAAPGRDDVARHLLARACADASEQDDWLLRCDLPPGHALHEVFCRAGGTLVNCQEQAGEYFMAKLFDPLTALRSLTKVFSARAAAGGLPETTALGIDLKSGASKGIVERYRLHVSRHTASITTGEVSRHSVSVRLCDLVHLVLGASGVEELAVAGRLKARSRKSLQIAAALFPAGPWWRPPLDDLLA